MGFILALNEATKGKSLDAECPQGEQVKKTVTMLDKFDQWLTEIPPTEQPQRFGNKSFREWYKRLEEVIKFIIGPRSWLLNKI